MRVGENFEQAPPRFSLVKITALVATAALLVAAQPFAHTADATPASAPQGCGQSRGKMPETRAVVTLKQLKAYPPLADCSQVRDASRSPHWKWKPSKKKYFAYGWANNYEGAYYCWATAQRNGFRARCYVPFGNDRISRWKQAMSWLVAATLD